MTNLLIYAPSIHRGTVELVRRVANEHPALTLSVVTDEHVPETVPVSRDFPLTSTDVVTALAALFPNLVVQAFSPKVAAAFSEVIANDHTVCRTVLERYAPTARVTWTTDFLRWDMPRALDQSPIQKSVKASKKDQEFMKEAFGSASKSADFWRQVGACIVKDGVIILSSSNMYLPSREDIYAHGDPASWREAGKNTQVSSAIHAEQSVISEAARRGISLEGTDIYVTTFPCQTCAGLIAHAGIARCFYRDGYSLINAEETLTEHKVALIQVEPSD